MKFMSKLLSIIMIMNAVGFMHSIYAMQLPTNEKEYSIGGVRAPVKSITLFVENKTDKSIWVRSRNRTKNYYLINNQEIKPGKGINAKFNLDDLITDSNVFGFNLWKVNPATIDTTSVESAPFAITFKYGQTELNNLAITAELLAPFIDNQLATVKPFISRGKPVYPGNFGFILSIRDVPELTLQILSI